MNNYQKTIGALNVFLPFGVFIAVFIIVPFIIAATNNIIGLSVIFLIFLLPVALGVFNSLKIRSSKISITEFSFFEKAFYYMPYVNTVLLVYILFSVFT